MPLLNACYGPAGAFPMGYRRCKTRGSRRSVVLDRAVAIHALDLTQDDAVRGAAQATVEQFGRIDILVNNAGITGGNAPTWELDPSACDAS